MVMVMLIEQRLCSLFLKDQACQVSTAPPKETSKSRIYSISLTKMVTVRFRSPSGSSSSANYSINSIISNNTMRMTTRALTIRLSKRLIYLIKCLLNKSSNYWDSLVVSKPPHRRKPSQPALKLALKTCQANNNTLPKLLLPSKNETLPICTERMKPRRIY